MFTVNTASIKQNLTDHLTKSALEVDAIEVEISPLLKTITGGFQALTGQQLETFVMSEIQCKVSFIELTAGSYALNGSWE